MSKKIITGFLCAFNLFFFTGCLDEVIEALCDEIGEANAIGVVLSGAPDLSGTNIVVTYTNENLDTLTFSECNGDFEGINGEINVSQSSVEFGSFLLSDSDKAFFFDQNGAPTSQQFAVQVFREDTCGGGTSSIANEAAATPVWTDLSDEVSTEQCSITAHGGVLAATYNP